MTGPSLPSMDPEEDDGLRCADRMRPRIQALIDARMNPPALIWSLTWGFADLLRQFEGDETALEKVVISYTSLSAAARKTAPACKDAVQEMVVGLRMEGFSTLALAWAMLGALLNIYGLSGGTAKGKMKLADELIGQLNQARQNSLN